MDPNGEAGPRITLFLDDLETATLRRVKQLGVEYVCMVGPTIPWSEDELKRRMGLLEAGGVEAGESDVRRLSQCDLRPTWAGRGD